MFLGAVTSIPLEEHRHSRLVNRIVDRSAWIGGELVEGIEYLLPRLRFTYAIGVLAQKRSGWAARSQRMDGYRFAGTLMPLQHFVRNRGIN